MQTTDRRRVGRYSLLSRLGEGGMGEVHRARAFGAEGVVKELCVKLIRAERLSRPGTAARFVGEARVSMRLNHGNIVAVFDFGRSGEDYYLAMEWVDGADARSIATQLSRRGERLAPDVAAHVVAEVARALSYAHALDEAVVHCDVKPENVLVSCAGDVKLADFGLATVARDRATLGCSGTPRYMAPEQRAGEPVGPPTDVWALGLLLAELTAGVHDPNAIGEPALAELARTLLCADPERRPSAAAVANELEAFVARARADGSDSPRERLAALAARGRTQLLGTAGAELEATASFLRDGTDETFLRSMSIVSTTPPSTPEGPRPRAWPRAALALVLASVALVVLSVAPRSGRSEARTHAAGTTGGAPAIDDRARVGTAAPPVEAASAQEPSAPRAEQAPEPTPEQTPARASARSRAAHTRVEAPRPEPAYLSVNAVPWGDVEIDGERIGVTPMFDLALAPGSHRVRFANAPMHASAERTIDLAPGERRRLVVDLASSAR